MRNTRWIKGFRNRCLTVKSVFYSSQGILFVSRCLMDTALCWARAHGATNDLLRLTFYGQRRIYLTPPTPTGCGLVPNYGVLKRLAQPPVESSKYPFTVISDIFMVVQHSVMGGHHVLPPETQRRPSVFANRRESLGKGPHEAARRRHVGPSGSAKTSANKGVRSEWHCRISDKDLRHGLFFERIRDSAAFSKTPINSNSAVSA
jgi:hypothetical protein